MKRRSLIQAFPFFALAAAVPVAASQSSEFGDIQHLVDNWNQLTNERDRVAAELDAQGIKHYSDHPMALHRNTLNLDAWEAQGKILRALRKAA